MRHPRRAIAFACLAAFVVAGCGKEDAAPGAKSQATKETPKPVVEEKVPPYAYAAPVKGNVKEVNIGSYALVDGIAYVSKTGEGTVVYVASKPIASPMLVDSACPLTQARALTSFRGASFAEATLNASGKSRYFAAGKPAGGTMTSLSPREWTSALKTDAGKVAGNVVHRNYGRFEFDLPLSNPKVDELSYGDRQKNRVLPATTATPSGKDVIAKYTALREAARKKDLKAMLTAMGFDAKQVAAIRGMEGIDADFQVFADKFLSPGTPGDPTSYAGTGHVRGEGTKANGQKFFNDYMFDTCGDRLVLTAIWEQQ